MKEIQQRNPPEYKSMPRKEELQIIIDEFDEEALKEQAILAILQFGGDSDESFIKANKQGLELFALTLLKAARDSEEVLKDAKNRTIPLPYLENWIDQNSDTFIQYIEPVIGKQKLSSRPEYVPTFADKLLPYGCGLVLLILALSVIVGLGTLINWLL